MRCGGFDFCPLPLGGDWTAAQHARACADVLACSRTLPFAVMRVYYVPVLSATCTDYLGLNGAGLVHAPNGVANGVGDYSLIWARSYEDAYGNAEPVSLHHGEVSPWGATPRLGTVEIVAPNEIRVRTFHAPTGAAFNSTYSTIIVW